MSATRKLLLPLALTLAIAACSKPADTAAPAADAAAHDAVEAGLIGKALLDVADA